MYRIIAVDDELLSLKRFEHLVKNEGRVSLEKTFSNPNDVLPYLSENKIDIAFLDIEMPGLDGLELAELIQEKDPYVSIVFVTAFDHYALDAFKAHAMGYLLKPLDMKEFSKIIDNLLTFKAPRESEALANTTVEKEELKLVVNCIGQFSCYINTNPDNAITFRTAKTAELFALLLNRYNMPISKVSILDILFPDMDYEKSTKLFYVSCSYLRNTFSKAGIQDVLLRDNDNYRINQAVIDCDYITLMENEKRLSELSIDELVNLSSYCNGEYLMGKAYDWAYETKAYLETLSLRILNTLADLYIQDDRFLEAMQVLEKYLIIDPCNEDNVEQLMTLYIDNGQTAKAKAIYNTFSAKLMEEFGLKPSEAITKLLE